MAIVLVAIGKIDKQILVGLKDDLSESFNKQIFIGKVMPEPAYAFNKERKQYFSEAILDKVTENKDYDSYERVLAVVDYDLYVPDLNFVFGQAGGSAALISITRLRQEYYGLPKDDDIFRKRILTEAVHELGHTYGLGHCPNPKCVMFFSNSLPDTDRKGYQFCPKCKKRLND